MRADFALTSSCITMRSLKGTYANAINYEKKTMSIQEMIDQLPPNMQKRVYDMVAHLLAKQNEKMRRKPKFAWEGVLKEMKSEYTSVSLQHQISDSRIGYK